MCNWAFELLRTNRSSLTLDFRVLLRRFIEHFGQFPARCITKDGENRRCDGNSAANCRRFVDSGARNQMMHSLDCDGKTCYRIS